MIFNRILNARLTSPLVRYFGMKTAENPAPTLAPEVSPGFEINNWEDPTLPFLGKTRLQQIFGSLTPVAAQHTTAQLRNPPTSGVLIVLEEFQVLSNTSYGMSFTTTDLAGVLASGIRDFRWLRNGGVQSGAGIFSIQSTAVPTFWTVGRIYTTDPYKVDIVIPPGVALNFTTLSPTVQNDLQLIWREVPVTPEELNNG